MNNRLYNCKNPYQGETKKVLCVCSAGLLRSPTAAVVLHREFGYNTRSCGADKGHALIPIDDVLIHWADEIVVMQPDQIESIPTAYRNKVTCLNIKDSFAYMDELLQEQILKNYTKSKDIPFSVGDYT